MTRIETEIYKRTADDLVGLKVITYDDAQRVIDEVIVVNPEDLDAMRYDIDNHNHDERYVSINSIDDTIAESVRPIVEELFNEQILNYQPPTFTLEANGDLYVEYHEGE
jgi:hypothetical protein